MCNFQLQSKNSTDNENEPSLFYMLEKVMRQVEYQCLIDLQSNRIDPLYKELCLIISETLLLKSNDFIKVNGSIVRANLIKEVFSKLQNNHLRLVFDNFHSVSGRVYNKKAYLRTALYNAVFELESSCVNDFCIAMTD